MYEPPSDNEGFAELERELRASAKRLSGRAEPPEKEIIQGIMGEHRRRTHRRRGWRRIGLAGVLVASVCSWHVLAHRHPSPAPRFPSPLEIAGPGKNGGHGISASPSSPRVDRLVGDERPVTGKSDFQEGMAIPFVLVDSVESPNPRVITRGVYVAPSTQRVDWADLNDAQKRAVRQILTTEVAPTDAVVF